MRSETTVGTEKRKRLVGVSLNAINYRHGAHGEITYFNRRAKRVNLLLANLITESSHMKYLVKAITMNIHVLCATVTIKTLIITASCCLTITNV